MHVILDCGREDRAAVRAELRGSLEAESREWPMVFRDREREDVWVKRFNEFAEAVVDSEEGAAEG